MRFFLPNPAIDRLNLANPRGRLGKFLTLSIAIAAIPFLCRQSAAGENNPPAETPASQPAAHNTPLTPVEAILSELGSDDPARRAAAQTVLLTLKQDDLSELRRAAIAHQPLLPTQILAIHQAVIQIELTSDRYEASTSGFLGLSWSEPEFCSCKEGLIVGDRFPGLCAARVLQPGDIIFQALDSRTAIHTVDQLRTLVSSMKPGQIFRLGIIRWGERYEVRIVLDAKPVDLETINQQLWINKRIIKAREFWKTEFAVIDPDALIKESDDDLPDAELQPDPIIRIPLPAPQVLPVRP